MGQELQGAAACMVLELLAALQGRARATTRAEMGGGIVDGGN